MVTSRMLVVVVGNVERARLEELVRETLGRLPRGTTPGRRPARPGRAGRALRDARDAAADELSPRLLRRARPRANPDYQALRVASRGAVGAVLHGDSFAAKSVIRGRRAVSRTRHRERRRLRDDGRSERRRSGSCATEIDRLQRELIDRDGLERLVQQFITDYFLQQRNERRPGDVSRARADLSGRLSRGESFRRRSAARAARGRSPRGATVHARFSVRLSRKARRASARSARSVLVSRRIRSRPHARSSAVANAAAGTTTPPSPRCSRARRPSMVGCSSSARTGNAQASATSSSSPSSGAASPRSRRRAIRRAEGRPDRRRRREGRSEGVRTQPRVVTTRRSRPSVSTINAPGKARPSTGANRALSRPARRA